MDRRLLFQRGVQYHRLIGVVLLHRHFQRGLGAVDRIASVLQLFAADGVNAAQHHAALQIVLGLAQIGLAQGDVGLILLAVDDQLVGLTHAVGRAGLGAFKRLLGIGRIERQQHVALLDVVGVVEIDAVHAAGHRAMICTVAGDVGVVGFLVMTQHRNQYTK